MGLGENTSWKLLHKELVVGRDRLDGKGKTKKYPQDLACAIIGNAILVQNNREKREVKKGVEDVEYAPNFYTNRHALNATFYRIKKLMASGLSFARAVETHTEMLQSTSRPVIKSDLAYDVARIDYRNKKCGCETTIQNANVFYISNNNVVTDGIVFANDIGTLSYNSGVYTTTENANDTSKMTAKPTGLDKVLLHRQFTDMQLQYIDKWENGLKVDNFVNIVDTLNDIKQAIGEKGMAIVNLFIARFNDSNIVNVRGDKKELNTTYIYLTRLAGKYGYGAKEFCKAIDNLQIMAKTA